MTKRNSLEMLLSLLNHYFTLVLRMFYISIHNLYKFSTCYRETGKLKPTISCLKTQYWGWVDTVKPEQDKCLSAHDGPIEKCENNLVEKNSWLCGSIHNSRIPSDHEVILTEYTLETIETANNKTFDRWEKQTITKTFKQLVVAWYLAMHELGLHETSRAIQHDCRKKLFHTNDTALSKDTFGFSMDYIQNIPVLWKEMTWQMYRDRNEMAFLEILEFQKLNIENEVEEEKMELEETVQVKKKISVKEELNIDKSSFCIFSDDSKHDTSWSTAAMRLYFEKKIATTEIKNVIIWSDGCGKEFKATNFLKILYLLAKDYKVNIFYNSTAASHGKYVHDAEGAVVKRMYFDGVKSKSIKFDAQDKQYSAKLCEYLNERFNPMSFKRVAVELKKTRINHQPTNFKSLKGMRSHYSFRINGRQNVQAYQNKIHYRRYSCFCKDCLNFNTCKFEAVVGQWKEHKFEVKY